jgi:cell fate regulator YaaT (PSP1 superfamily)
MIEIVNVVVRGEGFTSRYSTEKIPLNPEDYCLVETDIGIQIAKVVSTPKIVKERCVPEKLPKIIRKASEEDFQILKNLEKRESEAFAHCLERITARDLKMKLVNVIFAFDQSKALFMFTADGRIDFRELVRDLAHQYKTRIEMKQIGVRDEARLLGGIGICGCPLCCLTFLRNFHPVSIKMAKDQGLSLIPIKISGLCGRLMCCLQYEHTHYAEQIKKMPKIGKRVMTPKGEGRIRQLNILKGRILVELLNEELEEFAAEDVVKIQSSDQALIDKEDETGDQEIIDADLDKLQDA